MRRETSIRIENMSEKVTADDSKYTDDASALSTAVKQKGHLSIGITSSSN
jgi:hypothetical protein